MTKLLNLSAISFDYAHLTAQLKGLLVPYIIFIFLFGSSKSSAQDAVPRLFLDAPEIYLNLPHVKGKSSFDRAGVGTSVAMNVANYNGTLRGGGYIGSSTRPKDRDIKEATELHYGGFLEAGAGLYRTNGNRCAKDHHGAYTAMLVGGLRYDLSNKSLRTAADRSPAGLDYTLGIELGRFYIKDILRNTEFTVRGDYFLKQEMIGVRVGMKVFWNMKA